MPLTSPKDSCVSRYSHHALRMTPWPLLLARRESAQIAAIAGLMGLMVCWYRRGIMRVCASCKRVNQGPIKCT